MIGYTPEWAGYEVDEEKCNEDGQKEKRRSMNEDGSEEDGPPYDCYGWNDPPRKDTFFSLFVKSFVTELLKQGFAGDTVPSLEIYNEENAEVWWDGDAERYAEILETGARAVRDAYSKYNSTVARGKITSKPMQILVGGLGKLTSICFFSLLLLLLMFIC
jgi:hypothetical protein